MDERLEMTGQEKNLKQAEGEVREVKRRKRSRKTIGEEGSRRQTAIGLVVSVLLGLAFYLPSEIKEWWGEFNTTETITIIKPVGDSPDVSEVVGFEVKIDQLKVDESQKTVKIVIDKLLEDMAGEYGVYVKSLESDLELKRDEGEVFMAASVIKLPILVAYYQAVDVGEIDPKEIYVLTEKDRLMYGTGSMQNQPVGTKYSYQEVAFIVANQSDNMGAEVLIDKLGGYDKLQKKVDEWDLESISLRENEISLEDVLWLFEGVYKGELLKDESRKEMLKALTDTVNEDRLTAGVPSGVRVIHKFGSEVGVVNDCGVVEAESPYKISRVVWEWLGRSSLE